ncbi:Lpg1974 family pore-forming outer membrane protein [Legionella clemsonensis]|uniref:Legionella pneumophila major outer membrane protein n=1 Tax=Legionella clemsonensis TaxID=1867846 RepID=A0A222NYM7_9GAMM|nr:Lpg1974 family pore-forming outer membrane protein [Legionella clemsonensis]ASQ44686.1 Legionella pneumophila major outer membrane protein precursor [Legionella clemsonensis]
MLNLKKTAVAVLALGSSAVFAGTMGPVCTPGNVTVPCERTAWDFGVYALYLQPTYDVGFGYPFFTTVDGTVRYRDLDPDWGWGFKLEASYHFNTGNDLNLNWYHWNKETTEGFSGVGFSEEFDGPFVGSHRFEPKWDAVNLEFGQHVDFGEFKDIRFHAGVQYARIEHEITASGYVPPASVFTGFSVNGDHEFNGFGPRTGMDMTYNFGNGFAIYGNGAAALLVGDAKFNTAYGAGGLLLGTASGSKTTIVPELEAKLGAKYTYAMAQGDLTLDAGWMWVNYFNANHFISPVTGLGHESNFALHGPYAGLKWVGNV